MLTLSFKRLSKLNVVEVFVTAWKTVALLHGAYQMSASPKAQCQMPRHLLWSCSSCSWNTLVGTSAKALAPVSTPCKSWNHSHFFVCMCICGGVLQVHVCGGFVCVCVYKCSLWFTLHTSVSRHFEKWICSCGGKSCVVTVGHTGVYRRAPDFI